MERLTIDLTDQQLQDLKARATQAGKSLRRYVLEQLFPEDERLQIVRPSAILDANRQAVREAVSRYRTTNPRVFGSVLHGTDHEDSDIDILVDTLPGATLLDLGGLYGELEDILGVKVDLLTLAELPEKRRAKILAEAQPI